jgi:hypothetical protein
MLPLYEAKLLYLFDHRYGDYRDLPQGRIGNVLPRTEDSEKSDPSFTIIPRYWVQDFDTLNKQKSKPDKPVRNLGVASRLEARSWDHEWLVGWRDITNATNERTVISTAIPRAAVSDKYLLAFTEHGSHLLQANLSSFVLDYTARQKISGASLKYYLVKQLPVLAPEAYEAPVSWLGQASAAGWIRQRVLELSFTAWDMEAFAHDLGDDGPPFRWDEERRALIRAELDAAYIHLYGLKRSEVEHVMDSFDTLRRREEKEQSLGEFRTKRLILERYDAMAEAARTSEPYQTILDPPPGQGPRHG